MYKSFDELPLILTPKDIGGILGISKNNVYAILHSEGFPVFKVGKQFRVSRKHFIEWLEAHSKANIA
jgi:excisionase family DNA binding protein